MGEYKYGTNFTSVKVKHAPGGASSINLGWSEAPNPSNIRNSEKRQAIQDPFKSREGNRNQFDPEEHLQYETYQNAPQYNLPPNPKIASNPSYGQLKQAHSPETHHAPEHAHGGFSNYALPGNYFQPKDDPFTKPIELPQVNYFRQPEGANNYFRAPEGGNNYMRQGDLQGKNPISSQPGQFLMEKNFGKGQDVNYKEPERQMGLREQEVGYGHRESPQSLGYGRREKSPLNTYGARDGQPGGYGGPQGTQGAPYGGPHPGPPNGYYGSPQSLAYATPQNVPYGLPPRHGGRGSGPPDSFNVQGFKGIGSGEGRGQMNYGVKNSVKVSNPPGGQSSITFG